MYTLNMNVTIWSRKKTPFFDVEARVIIINTEDENKSSQVIMYLPIQGQDAYDSEIYELKQSFC